MHGGVGVFEEYFARGSVERVDADADTGSDKYFLVIQFERFGDHL